jgi:rhodanese-related sulfurtransferase
MAGEYTPRQVAELLARDEVQLVDVRELEEWEVGRIAGSAHIPLAELSERAGEVGRERPVVFYCRSGSRSALAAEAFAAAGYEAFNMSGGLLEWHADGLPLEPPGGQVA